MHNYKQKCTFYLFFFLCVFESGACFYFKCCVRVGAKIPPSESVWNQVEQIGSQLCVHITLFDASLWTILMKLVFLRLLLFKESMQLLCFRAALWSIILSAVLLQSLLCFLKTKFL